MTFLLTLILSFMRKWLPGWHQAIFSSYVFRFWGSMLLFHWHFRNVWIQSTTCCAKKMSLHWTVLMYLHFLVFASLAVTRILSTVGMHKAFETWLRMYWTLVAQFKTCDSRKHHFNMHQEFWSQLTISGWFSKDKGGTTTRRQRWFDNRLSSVIYNNLVIRLTAGIHKPTIFGTYCPDLLV